ncbi:MAG: diguanylate cyclase (GGDEF)-like protein [Gammaproteobacteria bacterium]|jgi:diguanylate cyclase (GGDEF)-like protein
MSNPQLQKAYAVLFDAIDNMVEGMVVYDSSGYLLSCNRAFRDMYNYTESDAAPGVHCDELGVIDVHLGNAFAGDENDGSGEDFFKRKWAYREKLEGSLTVKMQDGRWIRTTDRAMKDNSIVSIHVDVTDLKHAQEKIQKTQKELADLNVNLEHQIAERTMALIQAKKLAEHQARTDPLTGIKNRRAFFESANIIHQQTLRLGMEYVLLVIDIDNFKLINDNYGHLVGDQVLILLSNAIGSTTGASNIAGRIGGDEFAILLPELGTDAGRSRAKQLAICFAQKIDTLGALVLKPTLSIGVEQYRHGDNDTKSVMFRADKALYRAKQNGRNCIVVTTNQYSQ